MNAPRIVLLDHLTVFALTPPEVVRCAAAADMAAVAPELIDCVQVCDGTLPRPTDFDTMIAQARGERAFPGEGGIDLASMLRAAPRGIAISLECPTKHRSLGMSALERAKRGRAAVDALLAAL